MTTTVTYPTHSSDFSNDTVRSQLVDTLWCLVADEVERIIQDDPALADLDGDAYQEKRDEIASYLDDHLVITFIR